MRFERAQGDRGRGGEQAVIDLLAVLAYGELSAFQRLAADSAMAPSIDDAAALAALEPDLHGSSGPLHAWLLPGEGHIDTVASFYKGK